MGVAVVAVGNDFFLGDFYKRSVFLYSCISIDSKIFSKKKIFFVHPWLFIADHNLPVI
jgi:hypothetical protein